MSKQIAIFNKNLDIELGNVYVIFNHLSEECKLENSKNIFYINLPCQKSIKISQYINNKDLSIEVYKKLIEKYNLEFIKPREITDTFNQLIYITINEVENYDILIIGTMGLSFDGIKLIFQELINIAKNYYKTFILVQDTPKNIDIEMENVNELKLKDFETWYIDKSIDNEDIFIFKS